MNISYRRIYKGLGFRLRQTWCVFSRGWTTWNQPSSIRADLQEGQSSDADRFDFHIAISFTMKMLRWVFAWPVANGFRLWWSGLDMTNIWWECKMTDDRVCNLTEVLGIAKICLFPCRLACAVQSKTHICLTEIFSFQAQTFDAQSHVTEPEFMAGTWHGFFDVFRDTKEMDVKLRLAHAFGVYPCPIKDAVGWLSSSRSGVASPLSVAAACIDLREWALRWYPWVKTPLHFAWASSSDLLLVIFLLVFCYCYYDCYCYCYCYFVFVITVIIMVVI